MNFKIGDKIKVKHPGQLFSSYTDMAKILGADIGGKWVKRPVHAGDNIANETGTILNMKPKHYHHILIELDKNGDQWIISPQGLEKITIFIFLPDDLFEV